MDCIVRHAPFIWLSFGEYVESIEPIEARNSLRERAQKILSLSALIEKTRGRMAEDQQWRTVEVLK